MRESGETPRGQYEESGYCIPVLPVTQWGHPLTEQLSLTSLNVDMTSTTRAQTDAPNLAPKATQKAFAFLRHDPSIESEPP